MWGISYVIKGFFGLLFAFSAIIIFTVGPIIVSIVLQNPFYLFTYLISWIPTLLFWLIAYLIMEF